MSKKLFSKRFILRYHFVTKMSNSIIYVDFAKFITGDPACLLHCCVIVNLIIGLQDMIYIKEIGVNLN
jgi:hypothetical protein